MEDKRECRGGWMESSVVALYIFIFLWGWLLVLLLFFTRLWFIPVIYMTWIYIDRKTPFHLGRKAQWVRNLFLWKYLMSYFSVKLVKTANLDPKRSYIVACHPHGILAFYGAGTLGQNYSGLDELFPTHYFCGGTLNINFCIPVLRDLLLSMGSISCSGECLLNVLELKREKKTAVALVVGGAAESLVSCPGVYRLVLKRRLGFIKIALKTGSGLLPLFGFGEVELYDQLPNPPGSLLHRIQTWVLKKTGIGLCTPRGRGPFRLLPYNKPLTAVFGEPLHLPKIPNPTDEEVQYYHRLYIEKLTKLFYENREKYASKDAELIIE